MSDPEFSELEQRARRSQSSLKTDVPDLIAEIRRLQRQLDATMAPATAQGNRGPGWTTAERMFWHYAVTEP